MKFLYKGMKKVLKVWKKIQKYEKNILRYEKYLGYEIVFDMKKYLLGMKKTNFCKFQNSYPRVWKYRMFFPDVNRGGRTSWYLKLSRRTQLTGLVSPTVFPVLTETSSIADRWIRTLHDQPVVTRPKQRQNQDQHANGQEGNFNSPTDRRFRTYHHRHRWVRHQTSVGVTRPKQRQNQDQHANGPEGNFNSQSDRRFRTHHHRHRWGRHQTSVGVTRPKQRQNQDQHANGRRETSTHSLIVDSERIDTVIVEGDTKRQ